MEARNDGEEEGQMYEQAVTAAFRYQSKSEIALGRPIDNNGGFVWVTDIDRQSGMYIVGEQGTGKSSLLENLIVQDISKRLPVIVIDPHGDLVKRVIERIHQQRAKDTVWLVMEAETLPFGVNVFSGKKPQTSIEEA
jgi:predicted nucleotidyltransferase